MGKNKKSKSTKSKGKNKDEDYSSDEEESYESYESESSQSQYERIKSKKIAKVTKGKRGRPRKIPIKPAVPSIPADPSPSSAFILAPIVPPLPVATNPPTIPPATQDPEVILGYTPAQFQKYKQQCINLSKLSNQKLKECLKSNLQSMSGNKQDLIRKVADGIVLGRIPRCTSCYGGRPLFDYKLGTYTCKGYHDDTEMVDCDKVYQLNQIKREPWL